jgi:hypothetical protein
MQSVTQTVKQSFNQCPVKQSVTQSSSHSISAQSNSHSRRQWSSHSISAQSSSQSCRQWSSHSISAQSSSHADSEAVIRPVLPASHAVIHPACPRESSAPRAVPCRLAAAPIHVPTLSYWKRGHSNVALCPTLDNTHRKRWLATQTRPVYAALLQQPRFLRFLPSIHLAKPSQQEDGVAWDADV